MKKLFILLLFIGACFASNAQSISNWFTNDVSAKTPFIVICTSKDTIKTIYQGIVKSINPDDVKTVKVLKGKSATDKYGDIAMNGLLLVDMKPNFSFPTDLTTVSVLIKDQPKLPVYVDSTYTRYTEMFYLSKSDLKSISIAKEKITGATFINILTRFDMYKTLPDSIAKRH